MHFGIQTDPNILRLEENNINARNTLADLIIDYLASIGTRYIFGVPGGAIEPLYNALARASRLAPVPVHSVVARHESGAAFMADGYARETGRLGVCCSTTGPGTTNLITGVSSAYADRVPMLVITAQTALPNFGKLGLQESSGDAIDTVSMLDNCTRYNTFVSHPGQFEGKLYKALHTAFRKPYGPVHISVPVDILNFNWTGDTHTNFNNLFHNAEAIDSVRLSALAELVNSASKVVLFLGYGCRESINTIVEFAEHADITFVTTPSGKGLVNAHHPLYRGVFGFGGHDSARELLCENDVDLVIAVGTKLSETSTCGWDADALMNERLVHIEEYEENFSYSPMAQLHVLGNLHNVFRHLTDTLETRKFGSSQYANRNFLPEIVTANNKHLLCHNYAPPQLKITNPEACVSTSTPIKPQRLMCELVQRFPEDTRFLSDAGNSWGWTTHYLHPRSAGHYHIGMGFGAMAWAIGASIGVALGAPDKAVVCITGDGSYLMSGQEITVAIQMKLPVIYIILNDSALGMVKHGQKMGKGESIGYELPDVDYATIARALGAQAFTIRSHEDFDAIDIKDVLQADKPTLFDVRIDADELPPMRSRMKVLDRRQSGRRHASDRRYKDGQEND